MSDKSENQSALTYEKIHIALDLLIKLKELIDKDSFFTTKPEATSGQIITDLGSMVVNSINELIPVGFIPIESYNLSRYVRLCDGFLSCFEQKTPMTKPRPTK
jgi:hypothetical protein